EKELIYFCELIFRKFDEINVQWKRSKHWGNELKLVAADLDNTTVVTCFKDLFLQLRLDDIMKELLSRVYHYTDDAEIEHICSLTKSIIKERLSGYDFIQLIVDLFNRYIRKAEIVHYDAMITFCMRTLKDSLEEITGLGIDEFKLEEAHQHFIDSARIFLKAHSTATNMLYSVQGDSFKFYKKDGTT